MGPSQGAQLPSVRARHGHCCRCRRLFRALYIDVSGAQRFVCRASARVLERSVNPIMGEQESHRRLLLAWIKVRLNVFTTVITVLGLYRNLPHNSRAVQSLPGQKGNQVRAQLAHHPNDDGYQYIALDQWFWYHELDLPVLVHFIFCVWFLHSLGLYNLHCLHIVSFLGV